MCGGGKAARGREEGAVRELKGGAVRCWYYLLGGGTGCYGGVRGRGSVGGWRGAWVEEYVICRWERKEELGDGGKA